MKNMSCQKDNVFNEFLFCLPISFKKILGNVQKKKFIVFVTFENSKLNKKFLTDKKEVVTGNIFCKHIFLVKCK